MKKYNYVLLGVAISYAIIAIIQWKMPTPLSASIYITISFLSLEISFFEISKSTVNKILISEEQRIWIIDNELSKINNAITVLNNCNGLGKEIKDLENQKSALEKEKEDRSIEKRNKFLKKVESFLTAFEIIFCTIQVIISPLKVIPYDSFSTKMINCLSIISFAFLFFSLFVSNMGFDFSAWKEKLDIEDRVTNYFLNAMNKCNKSEED